MSNPFSTFCDDYYVNMRIGSQLSLPHGRETVLHFFERVQRAFPAMTRFRKAEAGDSTLEEERSPNGYRWLTLENRRLAGGFVNPDSLSDALKFHTFMLEQAPFHLGISPLEIDYLDVLLGFDLGFTGNHDEIVTESLLAESPLMCLMEEEGAKAVDFQPSFTVALSDDCRLQARVDVVTRTNSYQVRTGEYPDDVISVYVIVRRYWGDRPKEPMAEIFTQLAERADRICQNLVIPKIIRPLSAVIASRS